MIRPGGLAGWRALKRTCRVPPIQERIGVLFVMDDMVLACHVVIQGLERMSDGFPAQRGFAPDKPVCRMAGLAVRECFRLTRRPLLAPP